VVDTRDQGTAEPHQRPADLRLLADRYDIVGELRGSASARYFFGRRRDDGRDVLIAIIEGGGPDSNNALGHLASDARLLESRAHPVVARVLEGRWMGATTYAVVTERLVGPTLHELLAAEGALPNPRIATLLLEVNSALSWAREIGVVHRGVTPESLYIDPESRRPRVVLSLMPIPLAGLPDAASDAQTIGRLAWTMLTGRPYADDAPPLRELAPELSSRVIDETTAMANVQSGDDVPDVERFLSVVAMGDALRKGEVEMAALEAELRARYQEEMSRSEARAREIEAHAAELQAQIESDRATFEDMRREEERRIASERQQVDVERAQFEQERSEFADRVAEFELRASIERPAEAATVMPPLASERAEAELLASGSRFGWILPVATVALLIAMIVFGSVFARHRQPAQTVIFGRGRAAAVQPVEVPQTIIPRGGFLSQSAGSVGARIPPKTGDSVARPDSIARPVSPTRRDSARRRDTIPHDTLFPPDTSSR
jgi:hypothetical protein